MPVAVLDDPEHVTPFDRSSRPFAARNENSKEFGYEDEVLKMGRWRPFYYRVREWDPRYYLPTVTNSVIGPGGIEHARTPELFAREMPGRASYDEWRDRRYFIDPNVKAIYEKYPIAKQHPGVMFRISGYDDHMEYKDHMQGYMQSLGLIKDWPGIMPKNWKFHGAPFGEDCHVKTAVMAKQGLVLGTGYFLFQAPGLSLGRGWRYLLRQWAHYNSYTVPLGAAWAATSCISCSLRGKDDAWNTTVGGLAVGSLVGLRKSLFHGFHATIAASAVGFLWYYAIAYEDGLFTKPLGRQDGNAFGWDPNSFKWAQWHTGVNDNPPWNF